MCRTFLYDIITYAIYYGANKLHSLNLFIKCVKQTGNIFYGQLKISLKLRKDRPLAVISFLAGN